MSDLLPLIQRIEVMRLDPGDVIVANVDPAATTREAADRIRTQLERHFPSNSIVVTGGVALSVVRKGHAA